MQPNHLESTTAAPELMPTAGLLRRLAAMCYDSLLLVAIWMLVAGVAVTLNNNQVTSGPLMQLALLVASFAFFAKFWRDGGQTLGMRAWRLKVVNSDTSGISVRLSMKQCLKRFAAGLISLACAGLGFLWIVFDRDKLAWHDRLSATKIVVTPPLKPKPPKA